MSNAHSGRLVLSVAAALALSATASLAAEDPKTSAKKQRGGFSSQCDDSRDAASPCAILDAAGREILLRGVNARIQGIFDVDFTDGRQPLEPIAEFGVADTEAMRRIGFNFLRVPIQWSGIEPEMGKYDAAYVERIGKVLDIAQKAGIHVMLDMHQDAFSKEIGEDGAPLWAIVPPPEKRNPGGHLTDLLAMRLDKQTQKAFASFWKNHPIEGKGLQDRFLDAMLNVVTRYKDHPALVGMEIFNEPWLLHLNSVLTAYEEPADPSLNLDLLHSFYARAMPRMAAAAPNKLIFFEPDVVKNFPHVIPPDAPTTLKPYAATVPSPLPWKSAQTVYAPHFYVGAFFDPGSPGEGFPNLKADNPDIDLNMANSVAEAKAFKAPLLLGEFGFTDKTANYAKILDKLLGLADKHAAHTAQWVWKENSQDAWGFYDFKDGKPILRENTARATARAYPRAISGRIQAIHFNPATYELNVAFRYKATGAPHVLSLPVAYGYPKGYTVTCDGKKVATKAKDAFGQVEVSCGNKDGQSYKLHVVAKR